jgi:microcystin-dependent protein
MPYNVPNSADVAAIDLAEPDNSDFLALGFHRTGVVSGGTVTQSPTPAMSVLVAAAEIIIDGVPYSKGSSTVVLDAATSSPRFDLIGWNASGIPVAIKGTPSGTNPVVPAFDPTVFCVSAIVYISANAVSITNAYIVQKQVTPISGLRRNYVADTDVVLEFSTPTKASGFKALASGTLQWVSSTLARTSDTAMEWATSLLIRQNASGTPGLILKSATPVGIKGDYILQVQPQTAASTLAGIDTLGRLVGVNFRSGNGSPEGSVLADRSTIYLNEAATGGNDALYVKTTDALPTGWVALGAFVPSAQAIPVGCVVAWPGIVGADTLPAGYLFCDGSEYATATYPALSGFCGTKFGVGAAGNFVIPDYQGRTLFGIDGSIVTLPGINIGTDAVTLSIDQIPSHNHPVGQNPHDHPQSGAYPYVVPQAYLPPYNMRLNDKSGVGINIEDSTKGSHMATAVLTTENVGGGQSFSTYQPSQSVNWLIKT